MSRDQTLVPKKCLPQELSLCGAHFLVGILPSFLAFIYPGIARFAAQGDPPPTRGDPAGRLQARQRAVLQQDLRQPLRASKLRSECPARWARGEGGGRGGPTEAKRPAGCVGGGGSVVGLGFHERGGAGGGVGSGGQGSFWRCLSGFNSGRVLKKKKNGAGFDSGVGVYGWVRAQEIGHEPVMYRVRPGPPV